MNTLQLLQGTASAWLKVADQTELPANAAIDLLRAVNYSQLQVWRRLPLHYKQLPIGLEFPGVTTGTVTIAADGITLTEATFPAVQDIERYKHSSIIVSGDGIRNEYLIDRLLYRWQSAGILTQQSGTLYGDATIYPYRIERIVSPVFDVLERRFWTNVPGFHYDTMTWDGFCHREYQQSRVRTPDGYQTLFRLRPGDGRPVSLRLTVEIAPYELTLETSQRPVELPYEDEIAGMIMGMAGPMLITSRFFDAERLKAADVHKSAEMVADQLRMLPQSSVSEFSVYGTPPGF